MKKRAFTLAEVLITLTIVGVVAILVIPSVMRDIATKSRMTMLRSTVTSFSDAVAGEILHSRAKSIGATQIIKNPQAFLNSMDTTGKTSGIFAANYRNMNGSNVSAQIPSNAVMLKNGVALGITNETSPDGYSTIIVDINGTDEPNIVGADYFIFYLALADDLNNGVHFGDVGSATTSSSNATLKSQCLSGNAASCYKLAEVSGFDPNYIK